MGHLARGSAPWGVWPLEDVIGATRLALGRRAPWIGRRVVVSAGGTQEAIDPVRYVGNHSGKMGYAIAEALRDRGAEVTLISGASALPVPWRVEECAATSAREMARRARRSRGS